MRPARSSATRWQRTLTVAAHDYLITLFMFLIELLSENAVRENGGGGVCVGEGGVPVRVLD